MSSGIESILSREEFDAAYDQGKDACYQLVTSIFETLSQRLDELERRINQDSSNSSKPPSQDPFRNTAKKKRRRRRQGGKAGHPGAGRKLRPVDEVDQFEDVLPANCQACAFPFQASAQRVGKAARFQQVEIPLQQSTLTEFRLHALRCPHCRAKTQAQLPAAARFAFGPNLQAFVAAMQADKRMTDRQLQELLQDAYGVEMSLGSLAAIPQRMSQLLQPTYAQLHQDILAEPVAHADETSWAIAGSRSWIWGLFSARRAFYRIDPSRSRAAAEKLIPSNYAGVLHTDAYAGYHHIPAANRQLCWAHLKRHFTDHSQSADEFEAAWGLRGLQLCKRVFQLSGGASPRQIKRLQNDLRSLIDVGKHNKLTKGMSNTLDSHWLSLWHYLEHDCVVPTNNHAERMIRSAVIKRKLSLGSGSQAGADSLSVLMSISKTCRLQNRSPFTFISQALRASLAGQALPSLA